MCNDVFETKTTAKWIDIFNGTGLPFAPINNMQNTFAHPQAEARGMIASMNMEAAELGRIRVIGPAVKFSETGASLRIPPPSLGQHTDEVFMEAGMNASDVDKLRREKVV
jgi:succinate--hydroxymethylglutarate CoA-transferase